jgi:potassium large conductance calcium-activated channel subfamily M alpha protein 1
VILGDQGTPVDLHRQDVQDLRNATRMSAYTSDVDNILVAANVERLVGEKQEILLVEMHDTIGFFYLRPQFEISQSQVRATDYKRNRNAIVHLGPTFMGGKAVCAIFLGFLM